MVVVVVVVVAGVDAEAIEGMGRMDLIGDSGLLRAAAPRNFGGSKSFCRAVGLIGPMCRADKGARAILGRGLGRETGRGPAWSVRTLPSTGHWPAAVTYSSPSTGLLAASFSLNNCSSRRGVVVW